MSNFLGSLQIALAVGAGMFMLGLLMSSRLPRFQRELRQSAADPMSQAARKISDIDDFVERSKGKRRFKIDVEDSRDE